MKKPKAILFDFGNTILWEKAFDPSKGNKALHKCIKANPNKITNNQVIEYAKKIDKEVASIRFTALLEYDWKTFSKVLYDHFSIKLSVSYKDAETIFWEASEQFELEPGVLELLKAISKMEIPMGIVSNCSLSSKPISNELKKKGILGYFDFVISSSDYGIRKPHPMIFKLASDRINVIEKDIWFIGDSFENDVIGSVNAGMTPIWYNKFKKKFKSKVNCFMAENHKQILDKLKSV